MEGEMLIDATEARNEMIFERVNGTFSGVAAMNPGWGELKVDGSVSHKLFEGG
jgi:hypothetical protein